MPLQFRIAIDDSVYQNFTYYGNHTIKYWKRGTEESGGAGKRRGGNRLVKRESCRQLKEIFKERL